ncbi:hypothetical protein FRC07_000016 [Ceratobasidium sp. 392]|nr:hypothetical protein FRC07_000016 [Ceratobasidium sp. 392]
MVSTRRLKRDLVSAVTKENTDISEREKQSDESVGGDSLSEGDDIPARSKKRARRQKTVTNTNRKKYVRGKQGGLKGLMKLPLETFTEIAYLLNPGDLLSLARSSKFFRDVLLRRSVVQVWQCAENRVPGLPPCPPDMCEPQYAALLFSKYCTLCGASATARPDVYLSARLCSSCRDTKLQELNLRAVNPPVDPELVHISTLTRPKRDKSEPRLSRHAAFSLKHEYEELCKRRADLHRVKDWQKLRDWEEERRVAVEARIKVGFFGHIWLSFTDNFKQHARLLRNYLDDVELEREEDMDNLKEQRREADLGWSEEDMTFSKPHVKPWSALIDVPKPLTDRIWTNILPKLTRMLEENQERNIIYEKKKQRLKRRARVDKFLMHMKYTSHPFEPVFEALGVPIPPPPDLEDCSGMFRLFALADERPETPNPFPKPQTALEWDCLHDLSEVEMSIEEVETKLEERKAEIERKALEWRTSVERRLVEIFESGAGEASENVVVKVKDSTEPTSQLPRSTCLLLRADTLFKGKGPRTHPSRLWYQAPKPCYYPNLVSCTTDGLDESMSRPGSYYTPETDLDQYIRDTEAEGIVKRLLLELAMPDVTHIELQVLRARFICGRCADGKPRTWAEMANSYMQRHYMEEFMYWDLQNVGAHSLSVRHLVLVQHPHSLEPTTDPKPLIRLMPEDEATQLKKVAEAEERKARPYCYLCEATGRRNQRMTSDRMLAHMQEVHDVTEPVHGVYYGADVHRGSENAWREEWDAFHDARVDGAGSSAP